MKFKQYLQKSSRFHGFKIVAKDSHGQLYSIYDPNVKYQLHMGSVESPPNGMYLGTSRKFVMDYYSEMTEDSDVLLTYEYDAGDVLRGSPHEDGEILVRRARLIDVKEV
jgi:hypothetical protein